MKTMLLSLVLFSPSALAERQPQLTEAWCGSFMQRYYNRGEDTPPKKYDYIIWNQCTDKYDSALTLAQAILDRKLAERAKRQGI
jgi:hypothetical protein